MAKAVEPRLGDAIAAEHGFTDVTHDVERDVREPRRDERPIGHCDVRRVEAAVHGTLKNGSSADEASARFGRPPFKCDLT